VNTIATASAHQRRWRSVAEDRHLPCSRQPLGQFIDARRMVAVSSALRQRSYANPASRAAGIGQNETVPDFVGGPLDPPPADETALRRRMPDLPDVRHEADTPLGRPILTFTAAGQSALDWSAHAAICDDMTCDRRTVAEQVAGVTPARMVSTSDSPRPRSKRPGPR
jgi:hypothetical protein